MLLVENTLPRPKISEDVIPFTEYRRTLSDCLERTKRTHRPLFITQNGRATTVVMNIAEYEQHEDVVSQCQAYLDRVNLSRDVEISRREFAEGKGIPTKEVFDGIRERLLARQRKQARNPISRRMPRASWMTLLTPLPTHNPLQTPCAGTTTFNAPS